MENSDVNVLLSEISRLGERLAALEKENDILQAQLVKAYQEGFTIFANIHRYYQERVH